MLNGFQIVEGESLERRAGLEEPLELILLQPSEHFLKNVPLLSRPAQDENMSSRILTLTFPFYGHSVLMTDLIEPNSNCFKYFQDQFYD